MWTGVPCSLSALPKPDALPTLKVSDNRRFLVTSDGRPFFWLGDTAWELFHRLNREEAERYLKHRAAQGFSNRATNAVRSVTPLITEYASDLRKWVRRIVITGIVLLVAYFVFQVIAQASFFEWIGDRIDNLNDQSSVAGWVRPTPQRVG